MTSKEIKDSFIPFRDAFNEAMTLKGWTPKDLGHAMYPKDMETAYKLAANCTIWSSGRGKPGARYMAGVQKVLGLPNEVCALSMTGIPAEGAKRKSPVNRIAKLVGNGHDLTPAPIHRKAQPVLSFQIEADGMARIAFDIRLPLDKAFKVLDQLRQAGVVTEPEEKHA